MQNKEMLVIVPETFRIYLGGEYTRAVISILSPW